MDDKKLFYTSAIGAISLYLVIVVSLLIYISNSYVKSFDANTKVTVMELDLVSTPTKQDLNKTTKPKIQEKSSDQAKEIIKKSTSKSIKKTTSMKELYGNTSIKAAKVEKEKVLNIRSSMTSSRYKSKFEKEKKTDNIKVLNNLNEVKNIQKRNIQLKSNKNKDKYYSKIYQILSSRWQPVSINENLKAKILVSITSDGIFSYNFIQYSGNSSFDEQLMRFLDKQIEITYPLHSKGNTVDIEIEFKAQNR